LPVVELRRGRDSLIEHTFDYTGGRGCAPGAEAN
jgi:hypothetical protein